MTTTINLTNLDPDSYKTSFKNYLKSQTVFRDYNFDDSNMDMLLTILGHNTFLNSFYKNQIYSESILSKAQLRSSVVSKANELNYVPQSRQSSVSLVNIEIHANNINTLELQKGTQFSGRAGLNSFVFTTNKSYISKSSIGVFYFNNVLLFEGSYFSDTYIINTMDENQEFIISNSNVDISSISVFVVENNGSKSTEFKERKNTYDLTPDNEIYFIEGYQSEKYKIVFGNNVLGRYPDNDAVVIITYRVCTGINDADFISTFVLDEDIVSQQGGTLDNIIITTINPSFGGGERESIDSIKYIAPRNYAAQEAAITNIDYKVLIMKKFNSFVKDVNIFGGELVIPKQYGKVVIAIKPKYNDITPQFIKDNIYAFLRDYNVCSTRPIMIDADSFYLKINSTIEFNAAKTDLFSTDIEKEVITAIKNFSSEKLEQFDADFKFSNFGTIIDSADSSITSNDTDVKLVKRIIPKINSTQKFLIDFGNPIKFDPNNPSVISSKLSWITSDTNEIIDNCFIADDSTGILNVYTINTQNKTLLVEKKIGTVNYDGIVSITDLRISSMQGPYIELIIIPKYKNIRMNATKILYIDINDVNLEIKDLLNE